MYLNQQLDKIIDILTEIKGYNIATEDFTSYKNKKTSNIKKASFNFSKNDFLKNRFENYPHDVKEYLKQSPEKNVFELKTEDLNENIKESGDEMLGTICLRKDGRYHGKFYFQGKRYSVYAKSKTACKNKIRSEYKKLKNFYKSNDKVSKNMILNTWFDYWMNTFKKQTIKESTYLKYIDNYNRYIKNLIGKEKINNLNTSKLQNFINSLKAYTSKKLMHQILNELFELAYKENLVKTNPMNLVVIPKRNIKDEPENLNNKIKILTYSDELKLLNLLKSCKARCYHAVKFALYTGLRRGELLGLTWNDINLNNDKITINQQLSYATNKITSPKSKAAYRTLPLMPEAKEVLIELNKTNPLQNDFIFKDLNRFTQMLVYYSNKFKIEVNPHMLRHTFASRCYKSGLDPKVLQNLLGHESISTTLDTYTHIISNDDKEIIQKFRDFFIKINIISN